MTRKLLRFARDPRLWEAIALACILLLAAYMRMGRPGIVEFKRDEANLSLLAMDVAFDGELPLVGIGSSVGIPNAPVSVYILAIPYFLFGNEPQIATQFIGFLNVGAVAVTYLIGRVYFGRFTGLMSALVYATSPWAVIFSRKIWAQNMLAPFALLTLYTGLRGFVDRKRWAQAVHLPLLVFTGQIHYAAFVILPVTIYLIWQGRRRLTGAFYGGAVAAVLITMPYIVGMVRAGYDSPQVFIDALSVESAEDDAGESRIFTDEALRGARILISGTDIHSLAGPERYQEFLEEIPNVYAIYDVFWWIVVAASILFVYRYVFRADAAHQRQKVVALAIILWITFPIVIFTNNWTQFFTHYLVTISGTTTIILTSTTKIHQKLLITALIISTTAINITSTHKLLTFLSENHTPNGFGTPIHYLLQTRDTITTERTIGKFNGNTIRTDDETTIWAAILRGHTKIQFINHSTEIKTATTTTRLTKECKTQGTNIQLREANNCYNTTTNQQTTRNYTAITPTRLTNNTTIIGYEITETQCVTITWQPTQTSNNNYSFTIKIRDENNTQHDADGPALQGIYWIPGDTIEQTFCPRSEINTITEVSIGMYTYDGNNFYNEQIIENQTATNQTTITINTQNN